MGTSTDEVCEIYALHCPDSGEIRYIGKARDSESRLKTHIRDSVSGTTPVRCWIRALAASGKKPILSVLLSTWDWRASEVAMIAQFRCDGVRLLNLANGGDEPYCSTEQRALNGRKNAAAVHGDAARRRIWELKRALGDALRRGHLDDATKSKLRLAATKNPRLFGAWAAI